MKTTTTTRTLYGGTILTETRNEQRKLHDAADGTAARICTYTNGDREEQHYTNGKLTDPADGTPARICIYANGNRVEEHWTNGKLTDPADGTPAVIRTFPGGAREEEHWKDGAFVSVRHIPAPRGAK